MKIHGKYNLSEIKKTNIANVFVTRTDYYVKIEGKLTLINTNFYSEPETGRTGAYFEWWWSNCGIVESRDYYRHVKTSPSRT